MSDSVTPQDILDAIKLKLRDAGIVAAAIVDDTYDGITDETVNHAMAAFSHAMTKEENLVEVEKIYPQVRESDQIDLDLIRTIWANEKAWSPTLKQIADPLFSVHRQRLDRVNAIADGLKKLGLAVHPVPPRASIPEVQLVFLDYELEPGTSVARAQGQAEGLGEKIARKPNSSRAEKIAGELASRAKHQPFLVLMSEWESLEQVQAEFRRKTNYVGGTFAFLAKKTAAQEHVLYFHLRCWGVGHPALPIIRDFFATVTSALPKIMDDFRGALLNLDVHDYSFIQRLSLAADGEPLGEYMLQLMADALGHRLRNQSAIRRSRMELDSIRFTGHLPSTTQPSSGVTQLYREALTERGEEPLDVHPMQWYHNARAEELVYRVCQGDIFVPKSRGNVYVVINPSCDLQFSPLNPDRPPNGKLLLYLMEGTLSPFTEPPQGKFKMRTEPFEIDGAAYRITWQHSVVQPVPLGALGDWCVENGCTRIARLGAIHIASLQQAWTANIGRIGAPVAPPYFLAATLRVYAKSNDALVLVDEANTCDAIVTQHWREDAVVQSFTLTQPALPRLKAAFERSAEEFKKAAAAIPEGKHRGVQVKAQLDLAAEAEAAAQSDIGKLFQLVEGEHEFDRTKSGLLWVKSIQGVPITCFLDGKLGAKIPSEPKIPKESLLVLDILPSPSSVPNGVAAT